MTSILNGNKKDKKKRVLIQLRTNEEEKEIFVTLAKLSGMTLTDFLKTAALNKKPRVRIATFDREVLIKLNAQLGKVGSNINQIANALNTEKFGNFNVRIKDEYILSVLADLRALSNQILNELTGGYKGEDAGERDATSPIPDGQSGQ